MTESPTRETAEPVGTEGGRGAPVSARRLGMRLFLASLSMLFGGSLVGYLVVRLRASEWLPAGSQGLPPGLWLSTAIVGLLSLAMVLAERAARSGRRGGVTRWLVVALVLAVAFLAAQIGNWAAMASGGFFPQQSLAAFGFYVLTFLHAVHVLAGLVPLVFIAVRAYRGRYGTGDYEGIHLVGMYWHFLAVTWIAIFAVLAV